MPAWPAVRLVLTRAAVAAAVLLLVLPRIGIALSAPGVFEVALLAASLAALVQAVREPLPPLPGARASPGGNAPDRPFERIDRLEDRLSWGAGQPHHFDGGVRPVLARIAADRLHRRHGIDLARSPELARPLLGEDLWHLVTSRERDGPAGPGPPPPTQPTRQPPTRPPTRPPTPVELEAMVRRLEEL